MITTTVFHRLGSMALAIAVTQLAAGVPSQAADLNAKRTFADRDAEDYRPEAPSIWRGLYWGASVGYGWGESEHYYDRNDNHGLATNDLSGGLASLTLGYNYMISPRFLVGVEGDLGFMHLSADDKVIFDGHVWKSEFGPLWGTVRARAGMLFGETLLYATGGWAITEVDEVGYGDAAGQTAYNQSVRSGWVLGAGIERAIAHGMTAKIEYLHMDFGSYEGLSENREDYAFENRIDLVRAGINFKF
ncbi:MAG: porin family protein [Hyphomicrobiaceae bacterium]|nr:porin family protein [Hyphomicrobiaceae bacterium]